MSFLFGSAPKVEQLPSQPTVSPQQQQFMQTAGDWLSTGVQPPGIQSFPGPWVAPMNVEQTGLTNQLYGITAGLTPPSQAAGAVPGAAQATELGLLGFQPGQAQAASYDPSGLQAPQQSTAFTAPTAGYTPQTPTIDPSYFSQAFQQGVVQPLTQNFQQQIMPALKGVGGQSAGGIYSSDTSRAGQLAASNLNQQLAGAGAQYALGAVQTNQAAQLQTNQLTAGLVQGDQQAKLAVQGLIQAAQAGNQQAAEQLNQIKASTGMSDAQLAQQSSQFNVGAQISGAGVQQGALQQAGAEQMLPYVAPSAAASVLQGAYPTISAPQTTEEAAVQALQQNFYNMVNQGLQRTQLLGNLGTTSTIQPQTAVLPGQQGLIPSLLGSVGTGLAANPAIGTALLGMFSDRRLKRDIKRIGQTDSLGLPIYTFKYKTDPDHLLRVGVMAQDVEQVYPEAVYEDADGIKAVNYSRVLLEETYPSAGRER